MSPSSILQSVISYMRAHKLPMNSERVIIAMRELHVKFYEKHKKMIDKKLSGLPHHFSKNYPKTKEGKLDLDERWAQFFYTRKIFFLGEPKCKNCGSSEGKLFTNSAWNKFKINNIIYSWSEYCSDSCSKSSIVARNKRESTCYERYDVKNVTYSKIVREKTIRTNLRKYGCENINQTSERREKMRDWWKNISTEHMQAISEKRRKTNLAIRSVAYPSQDSRVRKKIKARLRENYGVENPSHSAEIQKRIASSWKNKKSIIINNIEYDNLQGYEPQALNHLILQYDAEILALGNNGQIKPFRYFDNRDNKEHYYFPDLKIKIHGKAYYVEVKSLYTSGVTGDHKDGKSSFADLLNKAKAIVKQKKRFLLMIMNEKGKLLAYSFGVPNKDDLRRQLKI